MKEEDPAEYQVPSSERSHIPPIRKGKSSSQLLLDRILWYVSSQKTTQYFDRASINPKRNFELNNVFTPSNTNMNTQNDALEKVAPLKNGKSWYLC